MWMIILLRLHLITAIPCTHLKPCIDNLDHRMYSYTKVCTFAYTKICTFSYTKICSLWPVSAMCLKSANIWHTCRGPDGLTVGQGMRPWGRKPKFWNVCQYCTIMKVSSYIFIIYCQDGLNRSIERARGESLCGGKNEGVREGHIIALNGNFARPQSFWFIRNQCDAHTMDDFFRWGVLHCCNITKRTNYRAFCN